MKYIQVLSLLLLSSTMVSFAAENTDMYDEPGDVPVFWGQGPDIDINVRLVEAVFENNSQLVEQLKTQGADINAKSGEEQQTPLMINISIGAEIGLIQRLLDYGAKVGIKDKYGQTVLGYIANQDEDCSDCSPEVIQLLQKTLLQEQDQQVNAMRQERKPKRIQRTYCLLWCIKKLGKPFSQVPTEVMKEIHAQLKKIDEQEIMKAVYG